MLRRRGGRERPEQVLEVGGGLVHLQEAVVRPLSGLVLLLLEEPTRIPLR